MRYLSPLLMMSLIACAGPPVDQAGYTPPETDQGTDGVDAGTRFGGGDAGDGTPPGSGPDGELGGNLPDDGVEGIHPDAGFDGIDEGLGNEPVDEGFGGGGRGDLCVDGSPSRIEVGYGGLFESLVDGDPLFIALGNDGGAAVEFSVRLDQHTEELSSSVELIDDATGDVLGSISPIGLISCVDEDWIFAGAVLPVSPAFDPFLLIGQTATLRIEFSANGNEPEVVAQFELSVMLELATD